MKRAVVIKNLPRPLRQRFTRALQLLGAGSQAQWLQIQIRRVIREAEARFGADLFEILTVEEQLVVEVIQDGAAEIQQIIDETFLAEGRVETLLKNLCERGILEERRKGGKTDGARGASLKLYFISETYLQPVGQPVAK